MSKKGKVLQGAERTILHKIMTFFEEEKNKKLAITPIDIKHVIAMKRIAKLKNPQSETNELTEVEQKLLENEERYQMLLKSFDNIAKRAAAATGVSERTLRRIQLEAKTIGSVSSEPGASRILIPRSEIKLSTPKRKKPRKRLDIDDFMICSIRNIIQEYYKEKKEIPTLQKILEQAKRDFNFPGQRGTLWKIITSKLGYKFKDFPNVTEF